MFCSLTSKERILFHCSGPGVGQEQKAIILQDWLQARDVLWSNLVEHICAGNSYGNALVTTHGAVNFAVYLLPLCLVAGYFGREARSLPN